MNSRRLVIVAVGLATGFSITLCVGSLVGGAADLRPSSEVHAIHAEQELECEVCHADAATSESGRDELRPGHPVCAGLPRHR